MNEQDIDFDKITSLKSDVMNLIRSNEFNYREALILTHILSVDLERKYRKEYEDRYYE